MSKVKYFIRCLIIAFVFVSCAKTSSFDVTGDPQVKFFTNNTSYGNVPQNAFVYGAVNVPDASGSGLLNLSSTIPASIQFPVYATGPVSQDVTITAVPDTTLIAAYNAAYGTNYAALPAGILNTDTALVAHIPKDSTMSVDSITITSNAANLTACTDTAYIVPVRLSAVSNPEVGAITATTSQQVIYIILNVEQRLIKYNATTADVQGTLISPRTSWSVSFTPSLTTSGSITDGSTTTYARWTPPVSPYGEVDVNMQASKNVSGIRLYTSTSSTYAPTQVTVYVSNDGINYTLMGSPLKANITYTSGYDYILFYKAIAAQYIKVQLYYSTSTNTNNGRVAEFDVYAD